MNVVSILLVDDEPYIASLMKEILERAGYRVQVAGNAIEATQVMETQIFQALIVDLKLPGPSGLTIAERARDLHPDCAVLLISGNATMNNVIEALRLKIDDFLTKPIKEEDLIRAVGHAIMQHQGISTNRQHSALSTTIQLGALRLDSEQRTAYWHESPLPLTPTEFCLLYSLAQQHGQPLTSTVLIQRCRGYTVSEEEARFLLKPHIANLRAKLEQNGRYERILLNHRGMGFVLRIQNLLENNSVELG